MLGARIPACARFCETQPSAVSVTESRSGNLDTALGNLPPPFVTLPSAVLHRRLLPAASMPIQILTRPRRAPILHAEPRFNFPLQQVSTILCILTPPVCLPIGVENCAAGHAYCRRPCSSGTLPSNDSGWKSARHSKLAERRRVATLPRPRNFPKLARMDGVVGQGREFLEESLGS